jgi:Flp pilus assembly protein TadG
MIPIRHLPVVRRGIASVEMALVLPLILLLLVGIWEVGRLVEVQQLVANAAREGARQAATGTKSYDEIKEVVLSSLKLGGVTDQEGITVSVAGTGGGGSTTYDPTGASQLDSVSVTVDVPYANVRWAFIDRWFFDDSSAGSPATIRGYAEWTSMKDIPITVDTTIPQAPVSDSSEVED